MSIRINGQRIAELRANKGLNIATLARKAGVSVPTLIRYEASKITRPHASTIQVIAQALEVPSTEIIITVLDEPVTQETSKTVITENATPEVKETSNA